MKNLLAGILIVVTVLYFICPVDLMPGFLLDDFIVALAGFGSAFKVKALAA